MKYCTDRSIQTVFLNFRFPSSSVGCVCSWFVHVSTCGKSNCLDMSWKDTHLSIWGFTADIIRVQTRWRDPKNCPQRPETRLEARKWGRSTQKFCCAKDSPELSGLHCSEEEENGNTQDSFRGRRSDQTEQSVETLASNILSADQNVPERQVFFLVLQQNIMFGGNQTPSPSL